MTQMLITVVSVEPKTATSSTGKPYNLVEVIYKNNTFGDKIDTAKINQYSQIFALAKTLQPGQSYEVVKEKNAAGFYQWLAVTPTVAGVAATSPAAAYVAKVNGQPAPQTTTAPQASVNRSFESHEERAAKQVYIVKQSSLSNAISTLAIGSKTTPDKEKVIELAQAYTDFVFGKQALVDMPNDLDDVPL
jgi:(p)ppGpp synthase/HD superfamily hydrolase